jgi:hypothetical protein
MTPLRDAGATSPARGVGEGRAEADPRFGDTWEVDGPAGLHLQKVDPPGGTTGRVGFGTGMDEAPVPDANPRQKRFRAKWYSGSREENAWSA